MTKRIGSIELKGQRDQKGLPWWAKHLVIGLWECPVDQGMSRKRSDEIHGTPKHPMGPTRFKTTHQGESYVDETTGWLQVQNDFRGCWKTYMNRCTLKVNILKQFKKKEIWRQVVKFRLGWNRFPLCDSRFHFRKNLGVFHCHIEWLIIKRQVSIRVLWQLWARNCNYICIKHNQYWNA